MDELQRTKEWFEQAIPEPTIDQATIQLGCHMEEFNEMFEALGYACCTKEIERVADSFKKSYAHQVGSVESCDLNGLFDAMIDQIVTAVGVCHMMGFDVQKGLQEVNRSNFSKFENGKPVFDENGKITKGENYSPPDLTPYI